MSNRILFLGRQPDNYAALWRHLGLNSYDVGFAASQSRALRALEDSQPDVIVVDSVSLPVPPEQMCLNLRQSAPQARIVLIAEDDTLASISYDYLLPGPTTWHRVLKSIEQALEGNRRQVLVEGAFVLDLDEQTIIGPAGEGRLTPKLFQLLELLMQNPNRPVARKQIMQDVWNTTYLEDTRTLDVHMSWLRGIIEPDPKKPNFLRTKRGIGYTFFPDGQAATSIDKQAEDTAEPGENPSEEMPSEQEA
ncbi:MAG: response regulator transcription factor [Chloroflexota bacterium]|nr:response regulator transcription factor [Chloroflexota bacterium]